MTLTVGERIIDEIRERGAGGTREIFERMKLIDPTLNYDTFCGTVSRFKKLRHLAGGRGQIEVGDVAYVSYVSAQATQPPLWQRALVGRKACRETVPPQPFAELDDPLAYEELSSEALAVFFPDEPSPPEPILSPSAPEVFEPSTPPPPDWAVKAAAEDLFKKYDVRWVAKAPDPPISLVEAALELEAAEHALAALDRWRRRVIAAKMCGPLAEVIGAEELCLALCPK